MIKKKQMVSDDNLYEEQNLGKKFYIQQD